MQQCSLRSCWPAAGSGDRRGGLRPGRGRLADVHRFRDEVERRSAFGPEDVLAILLDFGIGNVIEKQAALRSADARTSQLEARQRELACPALITARQADLTNGK